MTSNFTIDIFAKKRVVLCLGIAVFVGVILEIWLVNRLSTYGEQISRLEKTSLDLQLENQILNNQIDQKKAISQIEKQAQQLGLDKSYRIEYLKLENLALNSR